MIVNLEIIEWFEYDWYIFDFNKEQKIKQILVRFIKIFFSDKKSFDFFWKYFFDKKWKKYIYKIQNCLIKKEN